MSSTVSTNSNNPTKSKSKVRDSNIELLRILTICGVVVLHYNGSHALSCVNENSLNYVLLLALESLFICAVNLFVLISGYFLSANEKRRAIKGIELVLQVIVINVGVHLLLSLLSGRALSLRGILNAAVPNNYFVTFYVTLYWLSPYINLLLKRLSDKQFGILVALSVALFSVWPTLLDSVSDLLGVSYLGLYPTNLEGSQFGYSFLNFALMYVIGAYLKRKKVSAKPSKLALLLIPLLAALTVWQFFQPAIARAYSNPLVIALAVVIFLLFQNLSLKSKIINHLAKGAFTCFLLHQLFLPHIRIESVVNQNALILLAHILICVPLIFLICWTCWWVYDKISAPIFRLLDKKLSCLDPLLSPTDSVDGAQSER